MIIVAVECTLPVDNRYFCNRIDEGKGRSGMGTERTRLDSAQKGGRRTQDFEKATDSARLDLNRPSGQERVCLFERERVREEGRKRERERESVRTVDGGHRKGDRKKEAQSSRQPNQSKVVEL